MPKLFSKDEFSRLRKSPKGDILDALSTRGLVRKRKKKVVELPRGKRLSIKLYRREGVVYTKYSYPFVRSKTVEKTTGVLVEKNFPDLVSVPENPEELECLSLVKDKTMLLQKIQEVNDEHFNRIADQISTFQFAIDSITPASKMPGRKTPHNQYIGDQINHSLDTSSTFGGAMEINFFKLVRYFYKYYPEKDMIFSLPIDRHFEERTKRLRKLILQAKPK